MKTRQSRVLSLLRPKLLPTAFKIILFGPSDFSHRIGKPGMLDAPEVVAARKRVAAVARQNGKFAMTAGLIAPLQELAAECYRVIGIGADVVAVGSYVEQRLKPIQKENSCIAGGAEIRGPQPLCLTLLAVCPAGTPCN